MRWRRLALFVAVCLLAGSQSANAQVAESFMIVVVPDTQVYVQSDAGTELFTSEFEWIVDQRSARNIVFVSHVGDVSQNPSSVTEWDRIESVYSLLDAEDVPYGISPGNHDIDPDGTAPEYDARFGVDRYVNDPWFGGSHAAEGNRSTYQTLSVEGHELLFVHVRHLMSQFGDVDDVLEWLDQVLQDHPDHLAFVTTHEFTASDGTVRIPQLQSAIEPHCNVVAVFSGHLSGAANGSFTDACDRDVHHLLTNYQTYTAGGEGNVRLVEIDRLTLEASFQVYSPHLDEFRTGPSEQFTASLAPLPLINGDASCNRRVSVADALYIAQFAVGLRTARTTCPLPDPANDANTSMADVSNDGRISVLDAVLIAQCSAQLPNAFCPD